MMSEPEDPASRPRQSSKVVEIILGARITGLAAQIKRRFQRQTLRRRRYVYVECHALTLVSLLARKPAGSLPGDLQAFRCRQRIGLVLTNGYGLRSARNA